MQEQQQQNKNQQIFKFVSNLIADGEFKVASAEFFDLNQNHFKDEDENKHIYNTIFKEYLCIVDNFIDVKLQEKFSQEEIKGFFEDLEKNYKAYDDQDTIQILFTFTDFEKFKQTMIEYSKDEKIDIKQANVPKIKFSYKQGDFSRFDKYKEIDLSQWKCEISGNAETDFNLYTMNYEDTGLNIQRSEVIYSGISPQAIINKWTNPDLEAYKKSPIITEARYIGEQSEYKKLFHMIMNNPKMAPREYLYEMAHRIEENGDVKIIVSTVESPEVPITDEIIRADMARTVWIQKLQDNKLHVTSISLHDFKGFIPKMFMNMMMAKMVNQYRGQQLAELQMEEEKLKKDREEQQQKEQH